MLRLQTTKPSNGAAFDLDDLVDEQSLRATTRKIVTDAKVSLDTLLFFFLLKIVFVAHASFPERDLHGQWKHRLAIRDER